MLHGLGLFAAGSGRSGRGAGGGVASVTSGGGARRCGPVGQSLRRGGGRSRCESEGSARPRPGRGRIRWRRRWRGRRQHGQGDPPVPGGPAAHLVLIQAGQALAVREVLLDRPAKPGDLDQGGERDPLRGVAVEKASSPVLRFRRISRHRCPGPGLLMVTQAQSYHRCPLAPSPAESCCQARRAAARRAHGRTVRPALAGTW